MSTSDASCEYVFKPTNPKIKELFEVSGITDADAWHCPHPAENGTDLCCFHRPVDEKNDEEVTEAILDRIRTVSSSDSEVPSDETLQFVGAKLGTLSFGEEISTIDLGDHQLTFFGATIDHTSWTDITVNAETVDFQQTTFTGAAQFNNVSFDCKTEFRGSVFESDAHFYNTEFRDDLTFTGVDVGGTANFKKSAFAGDRSSFRTATFENKANFSRMEGSPNFGDVSFEGGANFSKAILRGSIFDRAVFDGSAYFKNADIPHASFERVTFKDEANFYGVEFEAAVQFDHATFEDGGYFKNITHDHLSFPYADLSGSRFDDAEILYANFDHANLTDTVFEGTDLRGANLTSAVLTRAMLFDANLRGTFLSGTVFSDAQINEHTRFLGHHTDSSNSHSLDPEADSSAKWCVYDPEYQPDNDHTDLHEARRVYKTLADLAENNARVRLQKHCNDRRKDLRKTTHN